MPFRPFRLPSEARAHAAQRREWRPRLAALARTGRAADRLALGIASTAFTGFLPLPGWWGSLAGAAAALLLSPWPAASAAALAAVVAAGTWALHRVHRAAGVEDPTQANVDEVAGAWLAVLLAGLPLPGALLPLALFGAFDMLKPWPANALDARTGAFPVLADDLVAGLWAGLLCRLGAAWLPALLQSPS